MTMTVTAKMDWQENHVKSTSMIVTQIPVNMENVLTRLETMSVNVTQAMKETNVKRTLMIVKQTVASMVEIARTW